MRKPALVAGCVFAAAVCLGASPQPPSPQTTAVHAREVNRLLIRHAMVIPGTGVPAAGPVDILIENGVIAKMGNAAAEKWPQADAVIDGQSMS